MGARAATITTGASRCHASTRGRSGWGGRGTAAPATADAPRRPSCRAASRPCSRRPPGPRRTRRQALRPPTIATLGAGSGGALATSSQGAAGHSGSHPARSVDVGRRCAGHSAPSFASAHVNRAIAASTAAGVRRRRQVRKLPGGWELHPLRGGPATHDSLTPSARGSASAADASSNDWGRSRRSNRVGAAPAFPGDKLPPTGPPRVGSAPRPLRDPGGRRPGSAPRRAPGGRNRAGVMLPTATAPRPGAAAGSSACPFNPAGGYRDASPGGLQVGRSGRIRGYQRTPPQAPRAAHAPPTARSLPARANRGRISAERRAVFNPKVAACACNCGGRRRLAPNTRKAYGSAGSGWERWAADHGRQALPAVAADVADYLEARHAGGAFGPPRARPSPRCIRYPAADPTADGLCRDVLRAIGRDGPTAGTRASGRTPSAPGPGIAPCRSQGQTLPTIADCGRARLRAMSGNAGTDRGCGAPVGDTRDATAAERYSSAPRSPSKGRTRYVGPATGQPLPRSGRAILQGRCSARCAGVVMPSAAPLGADSICAIVRRRAAAAGRIGGHFAPGRQCARARGPTGPASPNSGRRAGGSRPPRQGYHQARSRRPRAGRSAPLQGGHAGITWDIRLRGPPPPWGRDGASQAVSIAAPGSGHRGGYTPAIPAVAGGSGRPATRKRGRKVTAGATRTLRPPAALRFSSEKKKPHPIGPAAFLSGLRSPT